MISSPPLPARNALAAVWAWTPAGVLLAVMAGLLLAEPGDTVTTFATVFLGVVFEALPFLLLGVLVSAAIQTWVSPATIQRLAPRGQLRGALAGAAFGTIFPVCECGVVPVARRLLDKGASLSAALGFLLAGPVVNPVVFIATWTALGAEMAMARLAISLTMAVLVAWLYGLHPGPSTILRASSPAGDHASPVGQTARIRGTLQLAGDELLEMARYLVVGAAAAAVLRTLAPGPALLSLGQGAVLSVGLMMLLAAVLSICSVVDAFVALSLSGIVSSGAMLAFLVFGPVVDIKSALLYGAIFRWRTVAMLVLLLTQLALLIGVVINLYVG